MSNGCPVELYVHHVAIFTSDIRRSIAWYEEMLGFKKVWQNDFPLPDGGLTTMAWVKGPDCYIELYDYPKKTPPAQEMYWSTLGTKHISLFVKDGEFEKIRDYLKSKKVTFIVETKWEEPLINRKSGCKVIFILDPDGTPIEIQEGFTPEKY
jgi:catechol 2,3-dioxygenase-like lactoylglutathione lyase family enzyme